MRDVPRDQLGAIDAEARKMIGCRQTVVGDQFEPGAVEQLRNASPFEPGLGPLAIIAVGETAIALFFPPITARSNSMFGKWAIIASDLSFATAFLK